MKQEELNIRVELIRDVDTLKKLKPTWDNLLNRCPEKTPFLAFQWVISWWEVFADNRELFVIVIYLSEQAIGIFPLMLEVEKCSLVTIRKIQFIGVGKSDYLGPIYDSKPELCWHYAIETIYKYRKLWDVVELGRLRKQGDSFPELLKLLSRRKTIRWLALQGKDCRSCPAILIEGDWEPYLKQHMSAKHRSFSRGKLKKFSQQGELRTLENRGGSGLDNILNEIFALENRSWKGIQGKGIFSGQANKDFFAKVTPAFAESGWLSIYVLYVDKHAVAYAIGFRYNRRYYFYTASYDAAWREYSPGFFLYMRIIEECFKDDDMLEFDFLQGDEYYKLKLSNTIWEVSKVLLFHNGWRSLGLFLLEKYLHPIAAAIRKKYQNAPKK